jgi:hypothetical protein
MPGPGADDVPADDRDQLEAPRDRAGKPAGGRLELADAEQVPAQAERIGQRQDDALAVEQHEGQVVGDEVADRDRNEPGHQRTDADDPADGKHEPDDDRQPAEQEDGLLDDRRDPEQVEVLLGLGEPVKQDSRGR